MFRAELIKLRRSSTWLVVLVLPVLAVISGSINYSTNTDVLESSWTSLTSQITLLYGLFFFSLGVALLVATGWRAEHRGSNWQLMATSASPWRMVVAKQLAALVPIAAMQLVFALGTLTAGLILKVPGAFPWPVVLVCLLAVVTSLPLVGVQTVLSMWVKSFAVPVAICLAGCVLGLATITSSALSPLSWVVPQAINSRVLTLGSSAVAAAGAWSDALPLLGAAAILTAALVWGGVIAARARLQ